MNFYVEKCANQGTRRSNHPDTPMIDRGRETGNEQGRGRVEGGWMGGLPQVWAAA